MRGGTMASVSPVIASCGQGSADDFHRYINRWLRADHVIHLSLDS